MSDLEFDSGTFEGVLGDEIIGNNEPVEVYLNVHNLLGTLKTKYGEEPLYDDEGKRSINDGGVAVLGILGHPNWEKLIDDASIKDLFILLGLSAFRRETEFKGKVKITCDDTARRIYRRIMSFQRDGTTIKEGDIPDAIGLSVQKVFYSRESKVSFRQFSVEYDDILYVFLYLSNHKAVQDSVDEMIAVLEDTDGIEKTMNEPSPDSENSTHKNVLYRSSAPNEHNLSIRVFIDYTTKLIVPKKSYFFLRFITEPLKLVSRNANDLNDGSYGPLTERLSSSCAFSDLRTTSVVYIRRIKMLEECLAASIQQEQAEAFKKEYDEINAQYDM